MSDFQTSVNLLLIGGALSIVGAIIGAVVGATIQYFYSRTQEHGRRLWSRKVDAYSEILKGLHHLKRWCEEFFVVHALQTSLDQETKDELEKNYRSAKGVLAETIDLGEFLIDRPAVDRLRLLEKELAQIEAGRDEHYPPYHQVLGDRSAAYDRCIGDMVELARESLKLS
jgi:hypothetical protein